MIFVIPQNQNKWEKSRKININVYSLNSFGGFSKRTGYSREQDSVAALDNTLVDMPQRNDDFFLY